MNRNAIEVYNALDVIFNPRHIIGCQTLSYHGLCVDRGAYLGGGQLHWSVSPTPTCPNSLLGPHDHLTLTSPKLANISAFGAGEAELLKTCWNAKFNPTPDTFVEWISQKPSRCALGAA